MILVSDMMGSAYVTHHSGTYYGDILDDESVCETRRRQKNKKKIKIDLDKSKV